MTILSWEPELIEMPEDACHSHGAVAPWWTKVEIKIVILNIGIARDTSLQTRELDVDMEEAYADTVVTCPPLRCCATDLAMAGFSATQRILRAMPSSYLSCDNLHDACYELVPCSKCISSIYMKQYRLRIRVRGRNGGLSLRLVPKTWTLQQGLTKRVSVFVRIVMTATYCVTVSPSLLPVILIYLSLSVIEAVKWLYQ